MNPTLSRHLAALLAGSAVAACGTETREDVCATIRVDQECPTAQADVLDLLPDQLCESPSQKVVGVIAGPRRVDDETTTFSGDFVESDLQDDPTKVACCYDVRTQPIPGSDCVIGRPLRGRHGGPETAPVVPSRGWTRTVA